MSAHSRNEFEQLLVAHVNRELDPSTRGRLHALARVHDRTAEIDDIDHMHAMFDRECELLRRAMQPVEPREEADEVYQGLGRAAARVEQRLRSAAFGSPPAITIRRPRLFTTGRTLAAAAVLVGACLWAFAAGVFSSSPPEDLRLGGARIVLEPEINSTSREISWHAVIGARTYDVGITDADKRAVLARPDEQSRSTRWQLSAADFDRLRDHRGALFLRVVARDGGGMRIATTGDLRLQIR